MNLILDRFSAKGIIVTKKDLVECSSLSMTDALSGHIPIESLILELGCQVSSECLFSNVRDAYSELGFHVEAGDFNHAPNSVRQHVVVASLKGVAFKERVLLVLLHEGRFFSVTPLRL